MREQQGNPHAGYFGGENAAELAVSRVPDSKAFGEEIRHFQVTATGYQRLSHWGLSGDTIVSPRGMTLEK